MASEVLLSFNRQGSTNTAILLSKSINKKGMQSKYCNVNLLHVKQLGHIYTKHCQYA